jgi:predicted metal-dependent hydrolase
MDASLTIIRRPVKHARLRVREDSSVQLIVPHCFDQSLVDNLLQRKASWIARHQQYFRNRQTARPAVANDQILLFNKIYRFVRLPELGLPVEIDDAANEIRSARDLTNKAALARWYRAHASDHLARRITELSTAHRLPFKRLFIRSQRTKWGTCSSKGNISLNWRLILTPPLVIDYVILHELVHTKILNHSHAFWVHLRAIFPQAQSAIRWLATNHVTAFQK